MPNPGPRRAIPAALALALCAPAAAAETFELPATGASPGLLLHRQAPPGAAAGAPVVLLIHGATFPSALAAAYPLGGRSWLDDLSMHGFDAWALDFAGYGGARRYAEMEAPAEAHAPLGRTPEARRQIGRAADFILRHTRAARLSLVAHSWGTLPAASFASEEPGRVERLVLFGPPVPQRPGRTGPPASEPQPAHHDVTLDDQWRAFGAGLPAGVAPLLPRADFDAWGAAYLATDPASATRRPPGVRVPYGPLADAHEAEAGRLPFDPARVRVPTLVVRGEWDAVTTDAGAQWLLGRLGAQVRRYVVISRGTHRLHLEQSRGQLFEVVRGFLAEPDLARD